MCHKYLQKLRRKLTKKFKIYEEEFSTLLEESISKLQVKPGTIINGTVIDIKKDLVIVNADSKSEGIHLSTNLSALMVSG